MDVPGSNTHGHVVEDDDREFLFLANTAAITVSLRPPILQEPHRRSVLSSPINYEPCQDLVMLPPIPRDPYHNSILSGGMFMREMLSSHEDLFRTNFSMTKIPFLRLLRTLVERGYLEDSPKQHIEPYEALGMFLYLVSQKGTFSDVGKAFQHSVATVQDNYWRVVQAVVKLGNVIVRPHNNNPHQRIRHGSHFYPWFQDCIGAIDSTQIPCVLPRGVSRKNSTGMKVVAACDFDSLFVFVTSGWEASTHDSHIDTEASAGPLHKFPVPVGGKYYVADGSFTQCKGFMAPYEDHRNHNLPQDVDGDGEPPPQQMEVVFNDRHASLRSIVETTFGILKSRFPILTRLPRYKGQRQADVVLALCTIHNFIRIHGKDDDLFVKEGFTNAVDTEAPEYVVGQLDSSDASIDEMVALRDSIGIPMWHYAQHTAACNAPAVSQQC